MKKFLIYLVLLLQSLFVCTALAAPDIPPKPVGNGIYVQDYANVISNADKQKILSIGQDLDSKTTAQVAVLTVKSLDGYPIEEYALEVLRQWGIGTKSKNNGVLLLIAANDRKSRIEVGYGLEGVLPDGKTGRIQDQYMLPCFRKGDYSRGILQGYAATAGIIAKSEGVQLNNVRTSNTRANTREEASQLSFSDIIIVIGLIIFIIFDNLFLGGIFTGIILRMLFFRGGGRGGGFGGGSGGGGGSSRSW